MKKPTLTKRQREILTAVSNGSTDKAIAEQLGISPHTVGNHIAMILARLGANSRSHAVGIFLRA